MGADGAAVGMGGNHRCIGYLHNVPEALIADVTHVHQHSQALGFPYIFPPPVGQAAAGDIGAGKGIFLVPSQGRNLEAYLPQIFQQLRVKVETGRPLDGQHG